MEQKRLLIIDDEPDLCEILSFNLSTAGYTVDTALSGQEAMKKDVKQYDLILLDVMMPVLSGFDVARQLKLNPATASIPIIFLTALGGEPDMLHGFELGADDYISKPFSTREVLAEPRNVPRCFRPIQHSEIQGPDYGLGQDGGHCRWQAHLTDQNRV